MGAADGRVLPVRPPGRRAASLPAGPPTPRRGVSIDPSPALQRLEADVLAQAPSLDWPPRRGPGRRRRPWPRSRTRIPPRPGPAPPTPASASAPTSTLVGRADELAWLEAALDHAAAGAGAARPRRRRAGSGQDPVDRGTGCVGRGRRRPGGVGPLLPGRERAPLLAVGPDHARDRRRPWLRPFGASPVRRGPSGARAGQQRRPGQLGDGRRPRPRPLPALSGPHKLRARGRGFPNCSWCSTICTGPTCRRWSC